MILGYASQASAQSTQPSMADWLKTLQKNSKSEEQLQAEMLEGVSDTIEKMQEKRAEAAEEKAAQEASQDGSGNAPVQKTSSDDIKAPSEITKADITSPVDIKL